MHLGDMGGSVGKEGPVSMDPLVTGISSSPLHSTESLFLTETFSIGV